MPRDASDLDNHRIITFGSPVPSHLVDINYLEKVGRPDHQPRSANVQVNAIFGLIQAARAGVGIAMLPDYAVEGASELERVLPEIDLPEFETYFVYPPALKNSKRVGIFRDFLVESARKWEF